MNCLSSLWNTLQYSWNINTDTSTPVRRWDDWVRENRIKKDNEEGRKLSAVLRAKMEEIHHPKPPVKLAPTKQKKMAASSDLSSTRGSEDRQTPVTGRGQKRGRDAEIEKVGPEISIPPKKRQKQNGKPQKKSRRIQGLPAPDITDDKPQKKTPRKRKIDPEYFKKDASFIPPPKRQCLLANGQQQAYPITVPPGPGGAWIEPELAKPEEFLSSYSRNTLRKALASNRRIRLSDNIAKDYEDSTRRVLISHALMGRGACAPLPGELDSD